MIKHWFIKAFFFSMLMAALAPHQIYAQVFDEPLYRLMLEQVTPNGLWEKRDYSVQVRVDPGPFKGAPSGVQEITFAQIDETERARYIQLIREFEAVPADIEEDNICADTGGLPPPPRPGEPYEPPKIPEHCKEIGNFVTIGFAAPRLEKGAASDEGRVEGKNPRYVIRVIEISSYTLAVYDFTFDLEEDSRWEFIKKNQLLLVMS